MRIEIGKTLVEKLIEEAEWGGVDEAYGYFFPEDLDESWSGEWESQLHELFRQMIEMILSGKDFDKNFVLYDDTNVKEEETRNKKIKFVE